MNAFQRVLRAPTIREAVAQIPDVFYERFALVSLAYWVVAPLVLWGLGDVVGLTLGLLQWMTVQVGVAAAVLGAFLLAARWADGGDLPAARDPLRDNLPLALFGIFLLWAVVAMLIHPTEAALSGDGYRREMLLSFVSYVGFFFLASQVLRQAHRRALVALVVILVVVTCVVTLIVAGMEAASRGDGEFPHRVRAYFHQFNHYGYLLAIGAAIAAAAALVARRRVVWLLSLAAFAVILFTLLVNDTLGAYIAVLAGGLALVVWMAVLRRLTLGRLAWLVAVALAVHAVAEAVGIGVLAELGALGADAQAVAGGAEDAGRAGTGRWALWMITAEQIGRSPWVGHGIEAIAELLPGGYGRPHNEYLQYAVFFGIPALLAYVAALAVVLVRVVRRGRAVDAVTICATIAAFTCIVSACFGNTMYYTAPLFFVVLGVAWAGARVGGVTEGVPSRERPEAALATS